MDGANSKQPITLDDNFSTTRMVTTEKPVIENKPEDKFETVLFLPEGKGRKSEGGLRTKGYFKKSYPDKPLITVITVVFNGEKYLEETIQSIIDQTYDNVEYIIIDGCSSDGTLDIIRKYQHAIDYWVSENDKGIYDAMNKGIDLVTGEWIHFINVGDRIYEQDTLKKIYTLNDYVAAEADLIYGHCQIVYDNGFVRLWKAGDIKKLWKGMIFSHQGMMVKTLLMKRNRFNIKNKIGADFEFIYQAHMNDAKFYEVDIVIASVSAGGLSDTKRLKSIKSHWKAVRKWSNSLGVNLYYCWLLVDAISRKTTKFILPKKIVQGILKLKYICSAQTRC